jgi:FLVCR family feline leukemia virus subgroup C receptor-related protein
MCWRNITTQYREYKYRWVVLILYVVVSASGGILNSTCSPITTEVSDTYGIATLWVEMNSLVYEIGYIAAVIPGNYIVDTYELRVSVETTQMNIAAALTLIGSVVRLGAVWSFWPVLVGNGIAALGGPLYGGCTAKLSNFWFRPAWVRYMQRTNSTTIASTSNVVGCAIGLIIPPFFVSAFRK